MFFAAWLSRQWEKPGGPPRVGSEVLSRHQSSAEDQISNLTITIDRSGDAMLTFAASFLADETILPARWSSTGEELVLRFTADAPDAYVGETARFSRLGPDVLAVSAVDFPSGEIITEILSVGPPPILVVIRAEGR